MSWRASSSESIPPAPAAEQGAARVRRTNGTASTISTVDRLEQDETGGAGREADTSGYRRRRRFYRFGCRSFGPQASPRSLRSDEPSERPFEPHRIEVKLSALVRAATKKGTRSHALAPCPSASQSQTSIGIQQQWLAASERDVAADEVTDYMKQQIKEQVKQELKAQVKEELKAKVRAQILAKGSSRRPSRGPSCRLSSDELDEVERQCRDAAEQVEVSVELQADGTRDAPV